MSGKIRPVCASSGRFAASLGLEILDRPVGCDDEDAAEHRPPDQDPLVLEVGHHDPRALGRLDADRLLERDQEVALEQTPAQVVGDLQARRDLQLGVELAQRARGLLGVELDDPLALLAEDAKRALRRAQRGPDEAVGRVDDAEVRQRLGRRVEGARGVLLGDLARHEAHGPARRQAGDRLVRRVRDDRASDQRARQPRADDEREERQHGKREQVRRRAHAAAQILERAPAALRAAQHHAAGDEQRERRQPDDRLRPEEHRQPVPDRAHEPQRGEHDERGDDRDRLDGWQAAHWRRHSMRSSCSSISPHARRWA